MDGRPLDLGRPKQRAVLAELLIHANRVVSLDRFAEILWPGGVGERSTRSLPVYIANLRRLVEPERPARTPPERLLTRVPGYLLHVGPGEYDAADFERLAAEGNSHLAGGRPRAAREVLGAALALWRGRALEEFDFADMEAGRLEGLRIAATEDRIEADLALGAHTAVVAELEGLVQKFGLRERLVGLLMLALYRSGRQSEALRAYTAARDDLAEELGLEPGPDLRRLEARILAQSDALEWRSPPEEGVAPTEGTEAVSPSPRGAAPPTVEPDPFVGRQAELAALDGALAGLHERSGGIVLVSGEPGIGKTRLVREAFSHAIAGGCVVAWGCCEEGDGPPPFWPWIQVIRSLMEHPDADALRRALAPSAAELAQLVPEVAQLMGGVAPAPALDPLAARHRFFEAVEGFLERLSQHRPVAVVLDDIHWADPPSLELAGHLARRIPALGTLLVAIYRDVDPAPADRLSDLLAVLARLPARLDVSLAGLTQAEVAEFVLHEAGSEAPEGVVAALWARAAGNPFFVGELTRLLVAEKRLTVDAAAASTGVPWAVRQVVRRRVARLPAPTRQLLVVAAVAGQEFDLRAVAVAAGLGLDAALDLVDVAVAAGVVSEQPASVERFRFSHALVQEAIYEDANPLRRSRVHGLVADALDAVGGELAPATEVAYHRYEAVPVTGPAPAIAAAGRASASAQAALAPDVAEGHLRRALELVGTMPAGRDRDRLELDVQDQLAALLTLVKGVAVPETAAAWSRATELCREVEDEQRLLRSLWGLLSFAWASGDLEAARTLGEHLLRLGQASPEPVVSAVAYLGLGSVALCRGDLAAASVDLLAGKRLADGVADNMLADVTYADLRVQVDSWLAMARHLGGMHEEGRRMMDGALSRARALGGPFTVAIGLAFGVFARMLSGDDVGARELADELLDHSETHRLADFSFHARVAQVWTIAHGEFDEAELEAMVNALPPPAAAGIRPWRPFWMALIAEVWLRLGRTDEARRVLAEAFADVEAMGASVCTPELYRLRARLGAAGAGEALADLQEAVRLAAEEGAVVYLERAEAALAPGGRAGAGLAVARAPHKPGIRQQRAR